MSSVGRLIGRGSVIGLLLLMVSALLIACSGDDEEQSSSLSGTVEIDGSSTVFPISEAVAEEFNKVHPNVRVNVGISGTGGGFKRFTVGETDISDASRAIKDSERDAAASNGIEYHELRVGTDGLSVMVSTRNDFLDCLTVGELEMIWDAGSSVKNWNQLRSSFPDRPLRLYGPDTDSGTFDFFTEEINGEAQVSRADYTASTDDNVLVQGISGDRNALGYFGYAYYAENADKLKLVSVDNGDGCVTPTPDTILSGEYRPLTRPLFIYVNKKSLERPEVKAFVEFYMEHGEELDPRGRLRAGLAGGVRVQPNHGQERQQLAHDNSDAPSAVERVHPDRVSTPGRRSYPPPPSANQIERKT